MDVGVFRDFGGMLRGLLAAHRPFQATREAWPRKPSALRSRLPFEFKMNYLQNI